MEHTMGQRVLDCSSLEDSIGSLSRLFEIPRDDLQVRIGQCEIGWHSSSVSPEDRVLRRLGYNSLSDLPKPTAIRWFHATRAPAGTTFDEGLLPTPEVLPRLWQLLGGIARSRGWATEESWTAYKRDFETSDGTSAQQFHRKPSARGWGGPFAFLVKDAALGKHDDHKDFTKICEALRDICEDYQRVSKHPLRRAYEDATKPCLVIFTQPGDWPGAVRAALNFVHRSVVRLEYSFDCNTNFNGEGRRVPAPWLDGVEWL